MDGALNNEGGQPRLFLAHHRREETTVTVTWTQRSRNDTESRIPAGEIQRSQYMASTWRPPGRGPSFFAPSSASLTLSLEAGTRNYYKS
jgi:hypothetical protein